MSKRIYPVTVENGELVESSEKLTVNGLPIAKDGTIDSSYVSGGSSEWEVDANGDLVPVDGEPVSVGSLRSDEVSITNETLIDVYLSGNTSISANTWTPVPFDAENKDERGEFDTTANTWTVNETGWYKIYLNIRFNVGADGDSLSCRVKNTSTGNVPIYLSENTGGTSPHHITISALVHLTAGDTYEVQTRNSDSSDTIESGDQSTFLHLRRAYR